MGISEINRRVNVEKSSDLVFDADTTRKLRVGSSNNW